MTKKTSELSSFLRELPKQGDDCFTHPNGDHQICQIDQAAVIFAFVKVD